MKKMRIFFITVLATFCTVGLCMLVACGQKHEHKYSEEWSKDEESHWHAATCGHDLRADEADHEWDNGVVTVNPGAHTAGIKTYTCTVCKATKTEPVAETGHTYSEEWSSDENGHWHAATCDHELTKDYAEHSWDEGKVTTEPDCETPGVKTYTCTVCKATKTESVEETGHSYSKDWSSDTEGHWHASTCDHELKGDYAKHSWDEGKVTTEPGCVTPGVKTYTCTVCKATKTESVEATGHSYSKDWSSDDNGHWHASTCDHDVTKDYAKHSWDEGKVTTEPGCETPGVKTYTCTVCKATKTEPVEATGHTFGDEWGYNSLTHWKKATCGHENERGSEEKHNLVNGECACGYKVAALKFDTSNEYAIVLGFADGVTDFGSLIIPETYEDKPVTEIAASAFEGKRITSLTLPASVTVFGSRAFASTYIKEIYYGGTIKQWAELNCALYARPNSYSYADLYIDGVKIVNVDLPDGVTDLGQYAFAYLNIESVKIPSSVQTIGSDAFAYCAKLATVEIESGVKTIGMYAFAYCSALKTLVIPDSVEEIGQNTLDYCTSLEELTIPFVGQKKSATSPSATTLFGAIFHSTTSKSTRSGHVMVNARWGSTASKSKYYYIPETLRKVTVTGGNFLWGAFYGMSMLTEINIPKNLTTIPVEMFRGCTNLITVDIGDSVTLIDWNAFSESGIQSIVLPETLTTIAGGAFYKYSGESIRIPASVTKIGGYGTSGVSSGNGAFGYTTVKKVEIADLSAWFKIDFVMGTDNPLNVDNNIANDLKGAALYLNGTELTEVTVPSDITKVKRYALHGSKYITKLTIPAQVTEIEGHVFDYRNVYVKEIVFEDQNGWEHASSKSSSSFTKVTNEEISNPATMAELMTSESYCGHYWRKVTG